MPPFTSTSSPGELRFRSQQTLLGVALALALASACAPEVREFEDDAPASDAAVMEAPAAPPSPPPEIGPTDADAGPASVGPGPGPLPNGSEPDSGTLPCVADAGCPCTAGNVQSCALSGLLGSCARGSQECGEDREWGPCDVAPAPNDSCEPGNDDDCDGIENEGCPCSDGDSRSCAQAGYGGPCASGVQRCSADGEWGACDVAPTAYDSCALDDDGNCDGMPNSPLDPSCECVEGDLECASEEPSTARRLCSASGVWEDLGSCQYVCVDDGVCAGECEPGTRECDGNSPLECGDDGHWAEAAECDEATPCQGEGVCQECPAGDFASSGECLSVADCEPGEVEIAPPTPTEDRQCEPCTDGYTSTPNAAACDPWTECPRFFEEAVAPSPTSDRTCRDAGWTWQFGSSGHDHAARLGLDGQGNVYLTGFTTEALSGQATAGAIDVFVSVYDAVGTAVWTHQFGSSADDRGQGVGVDSAGNLYVAGSTTGTLPGQTHAGDQDAFIVRYDDAGTLEWTRQFGTDVADAISDLAVAPDGSAYVAGYTRGTLPGQAIAGDRDGFVRRYDALGTAEWTHQFGSDAYDTTIGIFVDASSNVYVVGFTAGALPGQTLIGGNDAFVTKYGSTGTVQWTRQFGTADVDVGFGVSVDSAGNVYVVGQTDGTFDGQASQGNIDAFLVKYDSVGALQWARQFGSTGEDVANRVATDATGDLFVVGQARAALAGQEHEGGADVFLQKFDAAGTSLWTTQFGTSASDYGAALGVDSSDRLYVAGETSGTWPGLTSAGGADAFVRQLVP